MHSLKALRGCDHVELARALAAEDGIGDQEGETRGDKIRRKVQLLSRAVDMARRDIAIAAINALVLPDDVVFQKAALAKLHEEQERRSMRANCSTSRRIKTKCARRTYLFF